MFRPLAIMAGVSGAALLGGCADIMQQQTISQIAPDWFAEKAIEVKGEGYPELAEIPQARPVIGTQTQLEARAEALKAQAMQLEAKLNADGAIRSDEAVRATAAQWRALVEEGAGAPPAPAAK